jgi:hypothetical protein
MAVVGTLTALKGAREKWPGIHGDGAGLNTDRCGRLDVGINKRTPTRCMKIASWPTEESSFSFFSL